MGMVPYSLHQNVVVERKNKIILDMTQSKLNSKNMPK